MIVLDKCIKCGWTRTDHEAGLGGKLATYTGGDHDFVVMVETTEEEVRQKEVVAFREGARAAWEMMRLVTHPDPKTPWWRARAELKHLRKILFEDATKKLGQFPSYLDKRP